MSLLISEPPLQVLPSLAVEIGLNEAVILQQVHYWVLRSNFEHEGSKWVYNTLEQWQEQFPFWSSKTIQRTLQSLRQSGYLKAKKLSQTGCDHTLYYTIDYDLMSKSNWTNCPKGLGQIDQNTINAEITTENKKKNSRVEYSDTFEKFWSLYPRGEKKAVAYDIWQKMKLDSMLDEILNALRWSIKDKQWDRDSKYCPYAERWLKNRRWEDMPKQPKQSEELFQVMRDGQKVMVSHAEYVEFKNKTMRIDG